MQKDKTRDKLIGLLAQGKKYTQGELAKELGTKQSAISKQLKRMEKRGWVIGHGATSNRYFELTKSGISAVQNPSQNGISRASKPENGISYTSNVFLKIDTQIFKELIKGAAGLLEEALIMARAEGLEIRQMDSSGIAMIVARIPKARFSVYRLGNPEDIGVNLENVSDLAQSIPNGKELTISTVQDGKRKLKLEWEGFVSNVMLEDNIRGEVRTPSMVFKAGAEIDGKLLQRSINKIIKASGNKPAKSYVKFRITKEDFTLKAVVDRKDISKVFDKTEAKLRADAQEQAATYNMKFIERMLKVLKKDTPVTVQLTTNDPMSISYHLNGVDFAYYIAPYIEDQEAS